MIERAPESKGCPTCGATLPDSSQRCSVCGNLAPMSRVIEELGRQASTVTPQIDEGNRSLTPAVSVTSGRSRRTPAALLVSTALAACAVLLSAIWLFAQQDVVSDSAVARPAASSVARFAAAADPGLTSPLLPYPTKVDLDRTMLRAKRRALNWHPDAVLTSLELRGVQKGSLNATGGGSFKAGFGRPSTQRMGARAPVESAQLFVELAGGVATVGTRQSEATRGLADPQCVPSSVIKAAIASGIPEGQQLDVHYKFSRSRGEPVWQIMAAGQQEPMRTLDAHSCTIILRP